MFRGGWKPLRVACWAYTTSVGDSVKISAVRMKIKRWSFIIAKVVDAANGGARLNKIN
jgi:ribosomal protein S17